MSQDGSSSRRNRPGTGDGGPRAATADAKGRRDLAGTVLLRTSEWECTLAVGEFLIGRDPSCWVYVDDALASREHARLRVGEKGSTIEDAGSANGVFVNSVRVSEPYQLLHGDRLLIGGTEIMVLNASPSQRPSLPPEERPTLTGVPDEKESVATVRAEAVEVLGRVAERLLAAGQAEKARGVLADQLVRLLDGARSGLPLRDDACQLASRYALKLARALPDGKWVDYTVELHLRSERAMTPGILADLVYAIEGLPHVDQDLIRYYADWLRQAAPRLPDYALQVAERLSRVTLPPPHR